MFSASASKNHSPAVRRSSTAVAQTCASTRTSHSRSRSTPSPVRALVEHHGDARVHGVDVRQQLLDVDVEVGEEVDLVDHDEVARAEHQRVLERLLLALGDRADHRAHVLADLELGRADEVADVLDHEHVDLVERQLGQRRADHVRVEMTLAAEARRRVQLRDRHVQRREPVGVHAALDVALEDAEPRPLEVADDLLEQRRLAGPGSAHQVDDLHARTVEVVAVRARDRVVRVERVLDDPHLCAMHAASSSSTSIESTSSSSPLTTAQSDDSHDGQRNAGISTSQAKPHAWHSSRAGNGDDLQRRALADRVARDEPEVELQRVRHHLAQVPDPHGHERHAPARRVADHGVDDRAGDRQLVH